MERTAHCACGSVRVVASGEAFADASFPPPVRWVWEQSMHEWVSIGSAATHFSKGQV